MHKLISLLSFFLSENKAFAHCDIPCGIYDPHSAQVAAHTMIRMAQLLQEIKFDNQTKVVHDITRITSVKEEQAGLLEEELTTLRNDYFKENHFKEYPSLEVLFQKSFILISKTRQAISLGVAEELLEDVLQISEIFYKSKGVIPFRIKSVYSTEKEIVLYK